MPRLIDADALMEQMKRRKEFVGRPSDPVCLVEDAPTIEAEPIRHGHWIPNGRFVNCSVCGTINCVQKYCGECGAKMDEATT